MICFKHQPHPQSMLSFWTVTKMVQYQKAKYPGDKVVQTRK